MTPAEFAAKLKAKYPYWAAVPDTTLVSMILQRYPQYKAAIQGTIQNMGTAAVERAKHPEVLAPLVPKAAEQTFRPGGPVDQFGRLWTPGAKGPTPQPGEDLFYANKIRDIIRNLK